MPKMKLPKGVDTPSVADFAGMGEITLLSKAQALENLLNHVEDLKGTPYEAAVEYLAEKAPWGLGHIKRIQQVPNELSSIFGKFRTSKLAGKGSPIGDIELNPSSIGKGFGSDPAETLGHELTHAAQALMKGVPRFEDLYRAENSKLFGYQRNPFEHGAARVGKRVKAALR